MTGHLGFLLIRLQPARDPRKPADVGGVNSETIWTCVDPLGEALHLFRMNGIFYTRSEFSAPWGLFLPAIKGSMMFHLVTSGRCRLEVNGAAPCSLEVGDLVLVPHGEGHRIGSGAGAFGTKLFDSPRESVSDRYDILRLGGGGAPTSMICGAVRFDHPAAGQLVRLLPKLIHIPRSSSRHMEWINSTLRFMAAEAETLRPGAEAVITRLADILVIQTLRAWIERDPGGQRGWLGALQHRQIGRVLSLVHRDPARDWSLESLAAEAAMSRSAFAATFTEIVGEPAMHYVTRWRMQLAIIWLKEEDTPISALASRLGYESEAAFHRAFKRYIGTAPGAIRRGQRSKTSAKSAGREDTAGRQTKRSFVFGAP